MNTVNSSITNSEVREQLQKDPSKILLIDVRSKEEYEAQHIPGALNIPSDVLPEHITDEELKGKTIVTICNHGNNRSQNTAKLLRDHNMNASFLEGGTAGWFEQERVS